MTPAERARWLVWHDRLSLAMRSGDPVRVGHQMHLAMPDHATTVGRAVGMAELARIETDVEGLKS